MRLRYMLALMAVGIAGNGLAADEAKRTWDFEASPPGEIDPGMRVEPGGIEGGGHGTVFGFRDSAGLGHHDGP